MTIKGWIADATPEIGMVCSQILPGPVSTVLKKPSPPSSLFSVSYTHLDVYKRQGVEYPNHLLWEITNFYPAEFAVGLQALDIISERLGYRLPRDEAGFIALHIVNAEIDGKMADMVRITEMIRKIVSEVQAYYDVALDEQSLDYGRFCLLYTSRCV